MSERSRVAALAALKKSRDLTKLIAMMLLSFTVIFVVGVLRPIRDAIALDGLEPGDFYQVYFVSAIVVLFVPLYNRLADRVRWKELIPGVALFFAASMVLFRAIYTPGSAVFGMAFYGWYDLMVAALVTQFFMATQIFYNARDAKKAYPLVIAAGSMGAAVGGGITAFFAQRVGTANLLLVAATAIVVFAIGIALVWRREDPDAGRQKDRSEDSDLSSREFRKIFSNRQVQLIAATVLLTVLVKQFVDYSYKTLTREVFQDLDRVSGFLGLVDAATQWLPILVLLALRPILRRWGAGVTVLIFPVAMIFATGALATVMTLPVAVFARTSERMFRYSAERTGRELLYVPVPDAIKLRAKAYIDVAIEKGLGKVLSGVVILGLVMATGSMSVINRLVVIGFVGVGAAVLLLLVFLRVRREYVRSLAASIQGRFASLKGTYVSLLGPGPRRMVREALRDPSPVKVAFALDLIEQDDEDIGPFATELTSLLGHESPALRARVLEIVTRSPDSLDETLIRARLDDPDPQVREYAARALLAGAGESPDALIADLLSSSSAPARSASLLAITAVVPGAAAARAVQPFFADHRPDADADDPAARLELATAAGLVGAEEGVADLVRSLMDDESDEVAAAAVASAARIGSDALIDGVIRRLGSSRTNQAARDALARRGDDVLAPLVAALSSQDTEPSVRRGIPRVLGQISTEATVDALIHSYMLPETEQTLDNRALAALARLRAGGGLEFPEEPVLTAVGREVDAAIRYGSAGARIAGLEKTPVSTLAGRTLSEATTERREAVFRWLGLLYPQTEMARSHLAIDSGEDRPRANALEWLESTIGHALFETVRPAIEPAADEPGEGFEISTLRELWDDEDAFIARLAIRTCFEVDPESTTGELADFNPDDPGLQWTVRRLRNELQPDLGSPSGAERYDMDLIEKVFLLQNVDLLQGVQSQQLALLASIARVIEADADRTLLTREEPTDAMYVVISGEVSLVGVGDQTMQVSDGAAFGTWALIDRDTSLLDARTVTDCRLLKIGRSEFHDLLVDYPELGLDLLQGLAKRLRSLATA